MAKSNPQKPPKPPKEKMSSQTKKKLYWGSGGLFFLLILLMILMPAQGSTNFGICKVYIELNELYPSEIKYLSAEDWDPVKVSYKKVDPFGVTSVNTVECYFKQDSAGNITNELAKIDVNGKTRTYEAEKSENIQKFNLSIPAILQNMPDLTLPNFSLDNIADYKDLE